jgi:hypothetical protein
MVVHRSCDAIASDLSSFRAERSMHTRAAVATPAIAMHATDFLDQLAIGGRSYAFLARIGVPSHVRVFVAIQ